MPRYRTDDGIPTFTDALSALRVDELRSRAAFVESAPLPSRKGELVALLNERLGREHILRDLWERLGNLERAAVSEVVHGWSRSLEPARFRAKYGATPDAGSALSLFLYGAGVMPDDLRERLREFVPAPAPAALATVDDCRSRRSSHRSLHPRPSAPRCTSYRPCCAVSRHPRRRPRLRGDTGSVAPVHHQPGIGQPRLRRPRRLEHPPGTLRALPAVWSG